MAPTQQDVVSGSNGRDNRPSDPAAIDVKRDVTEIISPLKESVTTALVDQKDIGADELNGQNGRNAPEPTRSSVR